MRALAILALIVVLVGMLAAGCGSGGASPSPTPVPTVTPVSTPTPTPSAVAEAWVARYQGRSGGADWAFAVAVDGSGNVYLAGKSDGGTGCRDFLTIKYVSRDSAP